MATSSEFERRRRERRRRERLRRKRMRALTLVVAFLIIVVVVILVIVKCAGDKDKVTLPSEDGQITDITETANPEAAPSQQPVVTEAPASAALNIPPASEQNDLMQIIRNSGETKHCYLTFDDGPTDNITPQILDTLRRYNVKATFFQIGSLIKSNPDMARRVYEEGHLIANHSDGHNYAKLYVSTDTFMNEVNQCYENIKEVTGEAEPFKLMRFPGGGFNSSADSYSPVKQQCKEVMKEYGFYYCDWNALNGDAEGKTKNAQELLDYMVSNLDGEDNVVVLMHDAAAKQATADALPSIIEYFMNEGYTFHRLDDIDYHSSAQTSVSSSDEDEDTDSYDEDDEDSSDSTPKATQAATAAPQPTAAAPSNNSGVIIIQ